MGPGFDDDVARAPHRPAEPGPTSPESRDAQASAPHGVGTAPPTQLAEGRAVTMTGKVRHVERTTEGTPEMSTDVLRFRLDQTDPGGDILSSASVHMRGHHLTGRLADGEEVTVTGVVHYGTIEATLIENRTTHSQTRQDNATAQRTLRIVIISVACLALVLFALALLGVFDSDDSGGGDQPTTSSSTPAPPPATETVTIDSASFGPAFQPSLVDLHPGDSITFRNARTDACRITPLFNATPADGKTINAGGTLTVLFPTSGSFSMQCNQTNAPPLTVTVSAN